MTPIRLPWRSLGALSGFYWAKTDQNLSPSRRDKIFSVFLPENRSQRPPWNFILFSLTFLSRPKRTCDFFGLMLGPCWGLCWSMLDLCCAMPCSAMLGHVEPMLGQERRVPF